MITWVTVEAFVPGAPSGALGASYVVYWLSSAALDNTYYKPDAHRDSSSAFSSSAWATPRRGGRGKEDVLNEAMPQCTAEDVSSGSSGGNS